MGRFLHPLENLVRSCARQREESSSSWKIRDVHSHLSVLVPVTFSLIELPLRLVVTMSATFCVSPALVVVPDAFVATLSV